MQTSAPPGRRRGRDTITTSTVQRVAAIAVFGIGAVFARPTIADGLVTTHRVSATLANEAVAAAVAACAQQGYAVTAVLVDSDGVRQAMLRGDGTGVSTLESAYDKAFTSMAFKTDTGALVERAKTAPSLQIFFNKVSHLLLGQGGILIRAGEEPIAGLGVGGAPGGEKDEACARAGLDKITDRLK
jgi:uncharacterized protein GlcG (DUF336 family)